MIALLLVWRISRCSGVPEDVALQLLDGGLDGGELLDGLGALGTKLGELDLEGLRPLAPRTAMVVAAPAAPVQLREPRDETAQR